MMTDSKSDEPEDLIEPLPGNKSLSNLQNLLPQSNHPSFGKR